MDKDAIKATGRRKCSVARIELKQGKGEISVNKKKLDEYFNRETLVKIVYQPLEVTDSVNKYDINIKVNGGGISGQAGAIRHGIARALLGADSKNRMPLKKNGFLTRDPRMVERKKYGQKGARKKFQFSKR